MYQCHPQPYIDYYTKQAGGGFPVFRGVPTQRGHGIGNVIGGLLRTLQPLAPTVGKTALRGGLQAMGDVLRGQPVKSAVKRRAMQVGLEAGEHLLGKARRTAALPPPPLRPPRAGQPRPTRAARAPPGQRAIKRRAPRRSVSRLRRRPPPRTSRQPPDIFT